MVSSFFVFTRIVSNPLSNVFQKKLTGNSASPLFIILITHLLLSLAMLPILFKLLPLELHFDFYLNIFFCVLLAIAGNTLIVAALRITDLSILGPINAYKSIVSLLLGIFLLGEIPTLMGAAGILLILIGSYFFIDQGSDKSEKNSFLQFIKDRGVQLRFAALVLSATEAVFLKKALLLSSPLITFVFWCILGAAASMIFSLFALKTRLFNQFDTVKQRTSTYLLLALTTGVLGTYYWSELQQIEENEEIDSALLADDLPINAYLDHGFHTWLEQPTSAASSLQE